MGVVTRKGPIYRGKNIGGGGYLSGFVGVVTHKGSIYRGKNTRGGPRGLPIWFCGGCNTQGIYILKIVPADKGNATVVMANSQPQQKMEEQLNSGSYFLLKKNPIESLSRKFDAVLKKLLKEDKISKSFYDNSRVLHPRAPKIYSLPKIHKPGNPIRPIVSFYDTPLSALHRQLSEVLKPPTLYDIRLKNSEDFLNKSRLQHLEVTFLSNGYPLQKIRQLMHTTIERARSNSRMPQSHTNSNLVASIPYFKSSASSLKKSLAR